MKSNFFAFVILAIVAFFAFSNVGGIFPTQLSTTGSEGGAYVLITPKPGDSNQSLQLQLIKFKGCSSTTAVDFLIDRSGSMGYGEKLPNLQKGILTFASKLSDQSVFGVQTYAEDWKNNIDIGLFRDTKSQLTNVVCNINPYGGTHSRSAFEQTKRVLEQAKQKYPDHKFALIFISDGIPETGESNRACVGGMNGEWCSPHPSSSGCRCFAQEQDPTAIAQEIKNMGVTIYSIAYIEKEDEKLNDKLQKMMERVATSVDKYYKAPTETEVIQILALISNEICKE